MRRLAALIAIALGVLVSCALLCGPPAEVRGEGGADRPRPSGERVEAGEEGGASLPLPTGERVGVRGHSGAKPESTGSSPDSEDATADAADDAPLIDPMSANAACYICHMTFIHEEFSRVHLKEKITCIDCHGVSAAHANDENIGATPPDIMFKRSEVDASCAECHEEHDAPARKIIARWIERRLPDCSPICTDCHGMHKIEQVEEEEEEAVVAEEAKEKGGRGLGESASAGLPEARSRALPAQPY